MKVTVPLALMLIVASAIGYLVGTESGRQQRELILVKFGRARAGGEAGPASDDPGAA